MATTRSSTLYTNRDVVHEAGPEIAQVYDAHQMGCRLFPIECKHTVVSADASGDSTRLCVIPHGARVVNVNIVCNGFATSAGGCTVALVATDDAGTAVTIAAAQNMGTTASAIKNLSFLGM